MIDPIEVRNELKIVVFDIETTDLDAHFGQVVCCTFKPYGKKMFTLRIDDKRNPNPKSDKWLVKEILSTISQYDVVVTWNGQLFDKRFLNTRSLLLGLKKPFPSIKHRDLCLIARAKFRVMGNRLSTWSERLRGYSNKTKINPELKRALIRLEKKALNFVVKHCEIDVLETELNYIDFGPYLSDNLKKT